MQSPTAIDKYIVAKTSSSTLNRLIRTVMIDMRHNFEAPVLVSAKLFRSVNVQLQDSAWSLDTSTLLASPVGGSIQILPVDAMEGVQGNASRSKKLPKSSE